MGLSVLFLAASGQGHAMPPIVTGPISRIPQAASKADTIAAARDAADRMTVPVMVNGQGPFPFVIDTGADRTVISAELATRLGLKPGDPVVLNGTGGVDLTPTAIIPKLAVGVREIHDVDAPMLLASNLGAMGMLGIDSLFDQRMVMDFRAKRMTVEASKREHISADVIVIRAHRRLGQLVLVDSSIGGEPILVILDSGAQNTIGNFALRDFINRQPDRHGLPVQVISVSGRTTPAQFASVPRIKIGGFSLHNLPIAFADLHTFREFDLNDQPAMLLGMDVLRHFDLVAVDFGRKEVTFQLPPAG
ncbi:MAG: retroviral-like aspartic protease family protein [Caulobacteraceae bacterium]